MRKLIIAAAATFALAHWAKAENPRRVSDGG